MMPCRHRCLSPLLVLALVASPALGARAPRRDTMVVCSSNLNAIGRALAAYRRAKGQLPPHLSNLYPGYLKDRRLFHCPADPSKGKPGYAFIPADPKLPISYNYEMNLRGDPRGVLLGSPSAEAPTTWRAFK